MTVVCLQELEKRYGDVVAIDSISLTINSGEFVALLGPSGCGKTTTLRTIAGLEEATSGKIFIGDEDVAPIHPRDRNVAMVFQSYALYPHMTVEQNMTFALRLRKTPRDLIEARVKEVASVLEIENILDRKPKSLSGGQQQRVALGRAMIRDPAVFLFDEPLSNLDAKLRADMRREIVKLHQQIDATMIYVTHDQIEAMTMADRIVVMSGGRVQQVGTPLEVYGDPANVFVAGFIGMPTINLFQATVAGKGAEIAVTAGGLHLGLPGNHPAGGRTTARLGIRPEHLSITTNADEVSIDGKIQTVEHLGAETILTVVTAGPELTVKTLRGNALKAGAPLTLTFEPDHLLAFDAQYGHRLIA